MNPVDYTVLIQKIFAGLIVVAAIAIGILLIFVNPTTDFVYLWAFMFLLLIFLAGIIMFASFWWLNITKKKIYTITQVNQIVYQSLISSSTIIFTMVLIQLEQLNLVSFALIFFSYTCYQIWARGN